MVITKNSPVQKNNEIMPHIEVIDQTVPTQSRRGKKRKMMTVGLSKRQRFSHHLHSKLYTN